MIDGCFDPAMAALFASEQDRSESPITATQMVLATAPVVVFLICVVCALTLR